MCSYDLDKMGRERERIHHNMSTTRDVEARLLEVGGVELAEFVTANYDFLIGEVRDKLNLGEELVYGLDRRLGRHEKFAFISNAVGADNCAVTYSVDSEHVYIKGVSSIGEN